MQGAGATGCGAYASQDGVSFADCLSGGVEDFVTVIDASPSYAADPCADGEQVVVECGSDVAYVGLGYGEQNAFFFEIGVAFSEGAHVLCAAEFEELKVVGVVDNAGFVGVGVEDAELGFVDEQLDISLLFRTRRRVVDASAAIRVAPADLAFYNTVTEGVSLRKKKCGRLIVGWGSSII